MKNPEYEEVQKKWACHTTTPGQAHGLRCWHGQYQLLLEFMTMIKSKQQIKIY